MMVEADLRRRQRGASHSSAPVPPRPHHRRQRLHRAYVRAALESRGHQVVGVSDHAGKAADATVDLLDAAAPRPHRRARVLRLRNPPRGVSHVVHDNAADYYRVNLIDRSTCSGRSRARSIR